MFEMKKSIWFAAAIILLFAGNAVAGSNAAAVTSLDYVGVVADGAAGNGADDAVVSGTVSGSGTVILVEVFAAGMAAGIVGAEIEFEIDTSIIKLDTATGGVAGSAVFPLVLPTTETKATLGAFAAGTPANGHLATVKLITQKDVTGVEFTVGVKNIKIAVSNSDFDEPKTGLLTFNSQPKVKAAASAAVIPRGESASTTITASGFADGAEISWSVVTDGAAQISVLVGDTDMGKAFTSTSTSITIKAMGAGAATATVTATVGDVSTTPAAVVFSEQVPVELANFGAELEKGNVVLSWTVASQTNNAGWRILRSADNGAYKIVSELIPGAGTTDALLTYTFTDVEVNSQVKATYVLEQIDLNGSLHRSNELEILLGSRFQELPTEFASTVFPNPFNPSTTISYDLPTDSSVSIVIYDALGQVVRRLVSEHRQAGRYEVQWDAKDHRGYGVGSGVYIAKIEAGGFSASQKMLLLK